LLLCEPRHYGVEYVINPWMEGNVGRADRARAAAQWRQLHDALAARAEVELIEPASHLPDMPFVANAGLVHDRTFVPSRFRHPQREPESPHHRAWFEARGWRIAELPGCWTFEGEGDALFQPGEPLLWGGYGVRTALQAHRALAELLDVEIVPLRLVDERFYHLDTCFCPLPGGRVLYHPGAFDQRSRERIAERVPASKRYAVDLADALHFACNAVVLGDTILTAVASPGLRAALSAWGFEVVVCPLDEFLLAGGGAKCLVLHLSHPPAAARPLTARAAAGVSDRLVLVEGHLLDGDLMNRVLDCITAGGGTFEIESMRAGFRHDQPSVAHVRVVAPSRDELDVIVGRLIQHGARILDQDRDARLETVIQPGVAPDDFYGTTIHPTEARVGGLWVRAADQRRDAVLVVEREHSGPTVRCRLLRDLEVGERVVCGVEGVRTHPAPASGRLASLHADGASEHRVELAVARVAWEMRRVRARGGRIVVVGGPGVIHAGGGPPLAALVHRGYVQALLGGNGLAVDDVAQALFAAPRGIAGGPRHHLRALNRMRAHGGLRQAVAAGVLRSGVMYECIRHDVPFALAGSIRDDGPLPETLMDMIAAQRAYADLVRGADVVLLLASMLHGIGAGQMTSAGTRLVCVDLSPAVVTTLAEPGARDAIGVVTDVGSFLSSLDAQLAADDA